MAKRQRGSRLGTMLVLVGLLAIASAIFGAGVYTGRRWSGAAALAAAPAPAGRATATEYGRGGRAPDPAPAPTLTFYQELTAPLTAPPPAAPRPPKKPAPPAIPEPPAVDAPHAGEQLAMHAAPTSPVAPPLAVAVPSTAVVAPPVPAKSETAGAAFTVQVGAYRVRPPADALRDTLAAAGHDVRVVEVDGPAAVRFRVRVGAFATREAAREAAARLAGERSLSTFVTTR